MAPKKLLLLADVHGNLEALKAVLRDAERIEKSFGEIIVLGDTVDYYAQPNECLELLKRKKAIILQGNHDAAAILLFSVQYLIRILRRCIPLLRSEC